MESCLLGLFIDAGTETVHKFVAPNTSPDFEELKRDCVMFVNRDDEFPQAICADTSRGTLKEYDHEKD